jgi:DNA-binding transcriptional regulator/RsmH inhibitor MraZ
MERSGGELTSAAPRLLRPFAAEYPAKIDDKWRVTIPAAIRDRFIGGLWLSAWPHDHLAMYEPGEWTEFIGRADQARRETRLTRQQFNDLNRGSAETTLDSAGRIVVPPHLRDYFDWQPGQTVTLVGNGEYVGIYITELPSLKDHGAALSAAVESLGL